MKILIAPDSFKGSLSAMRFCEIATKAIAEVCPQARIEMCPMADGGEGSAEAVVRALGGRFEWSEVRGPVGTPVRAAVGYASHGQLAVLDLASASGLTLVAAEARNPLTTTTYGTGELLAQALDSSARRIVLGLGGSATNDGGAGLLQALGVSLLDKWGEAIGPGAKGLRDLHTIALDKVHPGLRGKSIEVACDVRNPLLGANGASATFGPQKGAHAADIWDLELGLQCFADVVEDFVGKRWREVPGAGAAGGTGFGLMSLLGLKMRPGFDLLAEVTGLDTLVRTGGFDWVITGEGRFDAQSREGKLLSRLGLMAKAAGSPVIAFVGGFAEDAQDVELPGVDHVFPIVAGPASLAMAIQQTDINLFHAIKRVMKLVKGPQ